MSADSLQDTGEQPSLLSFGRARTESISSRSATPKSGRVSLASHGASKSGRVSVAGGATPKATATPRKQRTQDLPPMTSNRVRACTADVPDLPASDVEDNSEPESDSSLRMEAEIAGIEANAAAVVKPHPGQGAPNSSLMLPPAGAARPASRASVAHRASLAGKNRRSGSLPRVVADSPDGNQASLQQPSGFLLGSKRASAAVTSTTRRPSALPANPRRVSAAPVSGKRGASPSPPPAPRLSASPQLHPPGAAGMRGSVLKKKEADADKHSQKFEGAMEVFSEHPFFEGIKIACVTTLAKLAVQKKREDIVKAASESGRPDYITLEGEANWASDMLWIIASGSVDVEQNGEHLGTLREGDFFGAVVAFELSAVQPFTVRLPKPQEGADGSGELVCWCVAHAVVRQTARQFPDAVVLLQERITEQMKRLFARRASTLLFFQHCGHGFFDGLIPKMTLTYFHEGAHIVKGNEPADSMLMVVSGSVRVAKRGSASGKRQSAESVQSGKSKRGSDKAKRRSDKSNRSTGEVQVGTILVPKANSEYADDEAVSDDESDASSSSGGFSSDEEGFLPSRCSERSPADTIVAGPEAICFGEGILLNTQTTRGRPVIAASECIATILSREDFMNSVERHPREREQYGQMTCARYQEWRRSDIPRLASVELFCKCSDAFLKEVSKGAKMQLFFEGDDIVQEGMVPKGLLLLMAGAAEQISEDGEVSPVSSPHSFGTLEWLGVTTSSSQWGLKAKELCLVFNLSRESLLDALKDHSHESTAMVQQVLRHNGIRMSINSGLDHLTSTQGHAGQDTHNNRRGRNQNVWHMPFCKGCDPGFLARFTVELKVCKLVPGQPIFSPAPGHSNQGEDPDFLVVVVHGTLQVDETPPSKRDEQQIWKQVHAPLIITGFNRKHRAMVVTSSICEVHRLPISACQRLSAEFPRDLRRVLERTLLFMQRREHKLGERWWCPTKSLKHQAWFRDSDNDFLQALAGNLHTELYLPGEVLVLEGDPADSTMLLECGTADIVSMTRSLYSNESIGSVHDGYWIGEMAMFAGEAKRRATIKAVTVCKVQRLYNKELVGLLQVFPAERQRFRQLAEHRLRAVEKERLEDHAFFKDFDRVFLNMLRQKCRPQVFFANEVLMNQGEIADTLFILGEDSFVTLFVDGVQVKKIIGRACLGTKSLLSPRVIKRASTVITQSVCAVRTLTREDWLDALKLHPPMLSKLGNFTREQLGKVSEARNVFKKKRAWEKIHQREMEATLVHCERLADPELYVRPYRTPRSRRLAGIDAEAIDEDHDAVPEKTSNFELDAKPERWECFNGLNTLVPHTRLPQLGDSLAVMAQLELSKQPPSANADEEKTLSQSGSRGSFVYSDCEESLGIAAAPQSGQPCQ